MVQSRRRRPPYPVPSNGPPSAPAGDTAVQEKESPRTTDAVRHRRRGPPPSKKRRGVPLAGSPEAWRGGRRGDCSPSHGTCSPSRGTCPALLLLLFCIIRKCWDHGCLAMVTDNERDKQIEAKCGPDAVYFLSFERSLIQVGCIMTIISVTRNTLLIRSVPTAATEEEIKAHFTEVYPTCEVTAVTLGLDVTKLSNLDEERVRKDINALKCNKSIFCGGRRPKSSSKSEGLKVKKWRAEIASLARSIHWKNLPVKGFKWMGRFLLVNLAVLAGVTLLTTPAMMVNPFHLFTGTASITDILSPIVRQFGPSLLLWNFSTLLSAIVHCSTHFESHWSRSSEQLSTMRKLYFFLILLVLILPSLGLTSLPGLFQWLFQRLFHGVGTLKFE
ncbi:unnamed protein product [Pleuronectes platessa]|uniref:Uncharacterized protein n=1 Tax=Pleuronectes platessa TaxID=8262 RepID=A0A9N7W2K4_PLEPL|nr:unnamed protein product [Pleuronectes platessa]